MAARNVLLPHHTICAFAIKNFWFFEEGIVHFSAGEIRGALTYDGLIAEMRIALIEFSAGRVVQPLRTMMSIPNHDGRYAVMSAIYGGVMGTKMVSIYPTNTRLGLPGHASTIQLFNALTGQTLATMDGDVITEMRTAAVSALAADLLAPPDSRVLAILGAGVQARAHLEALRRLKNFDEIFLWNRSHEAAARWAAEIGATAKETISEAVEGADVIITATQATQPILRGSLLKPACLVIAVGAVHPKARELDDDGMRGALVVESREAAQNESGDVILSGALVYAELGEILGGSIDIPSVSRKVFKSVGIAVEDVAAAYLAYNNLNRPTSITPAEAGAFQEVKP